MATQNTAPKLPPPSVSAPRVAVNTAPSLTLGRLAGKRMPMRLIMIAEPGFGKSTFAAQAPGVAILMARGETGYVTLLGEGRAPSVDAGLVDSWESLLGWLDALKPGTYQHIAFDALGGFERLCHEYVCRTEFGGDWGEKGFMSYHRGYSMAVTEWLKLLSRLETIHQAGTGLIILAHSTIQTIKNPTGPDYDQFTADCHPKTWGVTTKWADTILFGRFSPIVAKVDSADHGKGIGGTERVIYTTHTDAWDAKNRSGLPSAFTLPEDHAQVFATINAVLTRQGESNDATGSW